MSTAPVSIWRATRSPWRDHRANWRFESLLAPRPIRFPLRSTQMSCQSGVPPFPITSAGGGGVHVPRGEVIGNPVGYDLCVSAELSRCRIELLRHQLAATCEQHKAAGVDRVGQRAEQGTVLRAIERGEVHGVILGLDGIVIVGDIKKVLTIRKKEGPAMRSVPGAINFRSRDRGPAPPPWALTRIGAVCVCVVRRIPPPGPQEPPRACGASQITRGGPPLRSMVLSFPSAKKASDRLSGDQKVNVTLSVLGRARPSSLSMARPHSMTLPSDAAAENAT